jgi:predicted NBD/HSP70 family sugar kinase
MTSGTTQDEVRQHNLSTLLGYVHRHGATSRSRLSAEMGLNRSTIKVLVAELMDSGYVTEEIPEVRSGAGRPSHLVVPAADSAYVLAANIGVGGITVLAVGLGGAVLGRRDLHSLDQKMSVGEVTAQLAEAFSELTATLVASPTAIGVSVPGVVREADGFIHLAPHLGWRDVAFAAALANSLEVAIPTYVGNDADLGLLAEHTRGAARGYRDVVYVVGAVGVGGGIVVDGRPLRGYGGYAGELGHMFVNPNGHRCRCGSSGCWETEIGGDALLALAGRPSGGGRSAVVEVLRDVTAGVPQAVAAVDSVGKWLARGVATLINMLNPQVVVLGGLLTDVYPVVADSVARELSVLCLAAPHSQATLTVSMLPVDSCVLGAAELAFSPLLSSPLVRFSR